MAVLVLSEGKLLLRLSLCEEQILKCELTDFKEFDEIFVSDPPNVLLIKSSIGNVLEKMLQLCYVGRLDYMV